MIKGSAYQATVQVMTPSTPGAYDLHWDVARQEGSNTYWFSADWPHPVLQIEVGVGSIEAYRDFTVDGPYSNAIAATFYGERSVNSATFSANKPPADARRTPTNSSVPWNIPTTDVWVWQDYRFSPDLTPIIQEIVNLDRWRSGNPITIIVKPADTGTTHRRVYAWDREGSSARSARLVIAYR